MVRHLASEIKRIDTGIETAFKSRDFEAAIALSSEGAALDSVDKQLSSRMLLNRFRLPHKGALTHAALTHAACSISRQDTYKWHTNLVHTF